MKTILVLFIFLLVSKSVFAQTYNPADFPKGTSTISEIKEKYTLSQIKTMLNGAEIYKNAENQAKVGIVLIDPITSEKMVICNIDSSFVMFEYLKKLRQEIITLNTRLQTAGIP